MIFASDRLMKRGFQLISLIILLGLTSCQRNTSTIYMPGPPRLPCKVFGASDEGIMALSMKLEKSGARVISIGQNYLVSIPACLLFYDQSPRILWSSYNLLNDVACYLKQFRKVAITITTYSNKYISVRREQALTLTRSRAVGDYLWSQGIDSRFLFTEGLGSDKPIIMFSGKGDASWNSRVEITFRRVVA